VPKLCGTRVLLLSLGRENADTKDLASCRRLTEQTERRGDSASPHNGSTVKLRGQGPRGYGRAARRLPACESRDAGGVPPCRSRWKRRLGRRTEAGPRQLLRWVSPPKRHDHSRFATSIMERSYDGVIVETLRLSRSL